MHRLWPGSFPAATLTVNIVGCLAIGLMVGWLEGRQGGGQTTRLLWVTGVLGGFTTFSAFSVETVHLVERNELAQAFANVALQVVLGIAAAWVGLAIMRR